MPVTTYKSLLGIQVQTNTVALPQSGTVTYFTVYGGTILLKGALGVITTGIGGAFAATLLFTPTTGTAANLCAASTITSWIAGDILSIDGVIADAMVPATHAGTTVMMSGVPEGVMINGPGNIQMTGTTSVLGNWYWIIWYVPVTAGAYVVNAL